MGGQLRAGARVPRGRFIAGDPLRGLAALCVVIYHASAWGIVAAGVPNLVNLHPLSRAAYGGVLGYLLEAIRNVVPIFFVLSGFLIARPFLGAFITGAPQPSVGRYIRNRLLRIGPTLWVVFTVLLLMYGTLGATPGEILAVYTFHATWGTSPFTPLLEQTWTLNVDAQFYVAIAALGALLALFGNPLQRALRFELARLALVLACIVAIATWSLLTYNRTGVGPLTLSFGGWLVAFTPGLALAAIEPFAVPWLRSRKGAGVAGALLFAAGVAMLLLFRPLGPGSLSLVAGASFATGRLYIGLMAGAWLAGALIYQWSGHGCWRFLDNRPLQWLGSRSYSFYLIHFVVVVKLGTLLAMHPIGGWNKSLAVLLLATLAITSALAEISYRFVELPARRLQRAGGPRAAPAPARDPGIAVSGAGEQP